MPYAPFVSVLGAAADRAGRPGTRRRRILTWTKVCAILAAALAVGLGAIGTGWAQSRIGSAGAGAIAEKPEVTGAIFVLLALPETMVILGFVVAALILFL